MVEPIMKFKNKIFTNFLFNSLSPLQAIQNLSHLIDQNSNPNEILKKWLDIMLTGFSHPEVFSCRIIFKNQEYRSSLFRVQEMILQYPLIIRGDNKGILELYYPSKQNSLEKSILNLSDELFFDIIGQRLLLYLDQYDLNQQLENQKLEFQTLIENDPDFVIRIDPNFHVLYLNPAAVKEIEDLNMNMQINSLDDILNSKFFLIDLKQAIQQVIMTHQRNTIEHEININEKKNGFIVILYLKNRLMMVI